ncbi:orotidine-5'-phosphate decarboxylase [Pannonibacter sp. SL95]|uniref:orotidine-5'-phosphate decarboxylase n=1 Tax=Pannonibacter sp. SL95 TaxID=2995153 RepID=UPI0022740A51|nr:orotidine-5'-phosphate decarboxylase [Pannonibacter sp. SL95]MCY1706808.1 orotidine-5'-phosphate decarboxylase [Pannonibacter sp. SL95]
MTRRSPFAPQSATGRLVLPLDVPTVAEARDLIAATKGAVGVYKIGMELQFAGGLELARELAGEGIDVFLDVKLLDIDNTIASAVRNIARMGVRFVTLHAYPKTMRAAVTALEDTGITDLCLLGVTVLTSMDEADVTAAGYGKQVRDLVTSRAADARAAGMGGLVCSPLEAPLVRPLVGEELVIVTPGVRPAGSDHGDQKRVMTPADAIRAGSDYLVIGRPISRAADPRRAAEAIVEEIASAL